MGHPGLFQADCISIRSAVGGKVRREIEDLPCPCNESYVSRSCCDAPEGLIWEAAELNLGVLELKAYTAYGV
jgi:hypothetical protein